MGIQSVIQAIQDKVVSVSGIRSAPDYAPDKPGPMPIVVTYAQSGTFEYNTIGAAEMRGMHTVYCDLLIPSKDLAQDLKIIMPYIETIAGAIMDDPQLSNTADTIGSLAYQMIQYDYAGMPVRGIRFMVQNIKIRSSI